MPPINPGSIPVGDHDSEWLRVMAGLSGRSMRVHIASVLAYYVRRRKEDYLDILAHTARMHGLTVDETFHRLSKGENLGPILERYPLGLDLDLDLDEEFEES